MVEDKVLQLLEGKVSLNLDLLVARGIRTEGLMFFGLPRQHHEEAQQRDAVLMLLGWELSCVTVDAVDDVLDNLCHSHQSPLLVERWHPFVIILSVSSPS